MQLESWLSSAVSEDSRCFGFFGGNGALFRDVQLPALRCRVLVIGSARTAYPTASSVTEVSEMQS